MGRTSSFCACLIILLAFCRLPIVGFAVSLADRDTLAERSSRELVASHCNDPFIPRSVVSPLECNLFCRLVYGDSLVRCILPLIV